MIVAKTTAKQMRLAQWTERIPSQTSRDPLGLANRVSQRLVNQLLFGMTVTGRRARYYAYYAWAINDVVQREQPRSRKALEEGIYWRDLAYMAACLLHHEEEDFEVDGIAGIRNGRPFIRDAGDPLDLAKLEHIESSAEGGFGLNFKGSMLGLGLVREVYSEDGLWLTYELGESPAVRRMVEKVESAIKPTQFYHKYACSRRPVPRRLLRELGEAVCVCLLPRRSAAERDTLRDMLFERLPDFTPPESLRSNSLRFVLHFAEICASAGVHFDEDQFRRLVCFGQCHKTKRELTVKLRPQGEFSDILNRWRVFFLHHYFSIGLEGLLIVTLDLLAKADMAGMTVDGLVSTLEKDGLSRFLNKAVAARGLTLDSTVQNLLQAMYSVVPLPDDRWCDVPLKSLGSEESLAEQVEDQLPRSASSAAAGCMALLAATLVRSEGLLPTPYGRWALAQVEDLQRDITAPLALLWLDRPSGSWRHMTLRQFLHRLLHRFVIEQHELMVPEKTQGTSWLRWDEGLAFFENAFEGPSPGGSRLGTAQQALCDLGLLDFDDERVPRLWAPAKEIISEIAPDTRQGGEKR
jgi:hypothetical protein